MKFAPAASIAVEQVKSITKPENPSIEEQQGLLAG